MSQLLGPWKQSNALCIIPDRTFIGLHQDSPLHSVGIEIAIELFE